MDILNEIKQTVKEELSLYEIQLLEALKSDSALLTSAVQYFLSKKGKNVRPLLVMLAAKSVFGIIKPQTIAGADFIKTSTGKMEPAATLEAAYVMCQAIKEY